MLTLSQIKGVGDATLKKLKELDIRSVFELFSFMPSRYIDLAEPVCIADVPYGQLALIEGQVEKISAVSARGKRAFYVTFSDLHSKTRLRFKATFYNLPYMHDSFEIGQKYRLLAKLANDVDSLSVVNPQLEKLDKPGKLSAGIFTQYPLRGVIGQNVFKNIMYFALDSVKAANYAGSLGAVNRDIADCFEKIHRPHSVEDASSALKKLASIDLAVALSVYKKLSKTEGKIRKVFYKTQKNIIADYKNALPFALTDSQTEALQNIRDSLGSSEYMSRIISGDVGSGKTVVAFFALYCAAASGHQAALMVPTEILAEQHARAFSPIADKLGIRFATLTSSTPSRERSNILSELACGAISCVIGTQSLIGEDVRYADLTLAVIDEQHKFGVNERKMLENKGAVDILSMTATPIPRSMALTFYDDIDISYVKKRAEAKTNVATHIVFDVEQAVKTVVEECEQGKQAFIVCPAIKDADGYDIASVESFTRDYGEMLKGVKYSCLHGKLNAEQKAKAMSDFARGDLRLLIATSVVEVGIDTKASVILILNADRFGLASLHQLRGRVGRDGSHAECFLQSSAKGEKATERLRAMETCNDGQLLAETDFEMRGGGEFVGTRQSGAQFTPIFGLNVNSGVLYAAKNYAAQALSELSFDQLISLTRQGESRVREFIENIKKVTLNS